MSSLDPSGWVVLEACLPNLKGSGNNGDLPFSAEELSACVTTVKTQGLCLVWADQVSAVLGVVRPWLKATLANMERRGSEHCPIHSERQPLTCPHKLVGPGM